MEAFKELFKNYFVSTLGNIESTKTGERRRLKPFDNGTGYLQIGLMVDGKTKNYYVHRLVAQAFIPNPEGKSQVNHINGIKTDNRVENLEWCTSSENNLHAFANNLSVPARGINHCEAKLNGEQIFYVRENPNALTTVELAKMFGVAQQTISAIQMGQRYKNVGGTIRQGRQLVFLSKEQRAEVRQLYVKYSKEFGSYALAKKFGVNQQTILNIVKEVT